VTTFLLVRHATCDAVGSRIAGRAPGEHLNDEGRAQAARLAERLAGITIEALYSSPLERARETAQAVAAKLGVDVRISDALTEIDFGEWTGASLDALHADPQWRRFNSFRSGTPIPGGESMLDAQARGVAELHRLRCGHPDGTVVLVSHGDVIKAMIAYHAGIAIDLMHRLEIAPASVSVVEVSEHGARIVGIDTAREWPAG
jgi:probable phosphoglycerate mutase